MIAALIAKDLRAHATVAMTATLAGAGIGVLLLFSAIGTEASSLLDPVRSSVQALGPLFAWLAAHRLFVLEQKDGTIEMITVLPIDLERVAVAKLVLALAATLGFALTLLFGAAALVSSIEYLDRPILSMAALQLGSFVVCWWGIASFAAQLGRYRISVLTVVLAWSLVVDKIDDTLSPMSGPLSVGFHAAVLDPPWIGIAGASALGVAFAIAAATIFSWRAGALARELQVRRETNFNLMLFLSIAIFLTVLELQGFSPDTASKAKSTDMARAGHVVRAGGKTGDRLYALAARLDEDLARLEREVKLEKFDELVVLPALSTTRWIADTMPGFDVPAYNVDLDASDEDLERELLRAVLEERAIDDAEPARAWFTAGFATFWLERAKGPRAIERRRAEYAALHLAPDAIEWPELEARLGRELAGAVAWQGVEAIAEVCGEARAYEVARVRLGVARSSRASVRAFEEVARGGNDRGCGIDSAEVAKAWSGRLAALARGAAGEVRALPAPPNVRVERTRNPEAFDLRLEVRSSSTSTSTSTSTRGLELWWSHIDPLLSREAVISPRHRPLRVVPLERDRSRVTLPLDPREHALATVAFWCEPLALWIIAPWEDVSAR